MEEINITRLEERVKQLEKTQASQSDQSESINCLNREVVRLDERIKNLERWQETQNGALLRLEEKMDSLIRIVIGAFASGMISLILLAINLYKR